MIKAFFNLIVETFLLPGAVVVNTCQYYHLLLEKFKSGCFNPFKFLENDKKEHKVKIQRRFQLTRVYINRERKRTQRVAINQKGF